MPIDPWLPRAAAQHPGRVALEAPEGKLTYAELLDAARIDAAPGSRVALALPPGLGFAVALHACLVARAAAVPVDTRLGEAEQEALLASADLVVDGPLPRCGAAQPVAPRDGDAALVVHTSGTTGAPRPVELSFGNVQANALGSAVALGLDPDERWLCPLPLSHVGGLMVLLRSVIYGTRAVIGGAERATGDDITVVSLVPTQLRRLLGAGARPGARLRVVLLGGAAATPDLLEEARAAGWPVRATYGLTQACSQVAVDGRPLPGLAVTLAEDGEVLVEGPTVAGGGVLHTGDLGRVAADGRLEIVGRKSDTIVTGGENVAPAEVEAALLAHPAVADAGVFGRPDPEWGEAVTASVVLRAPADPQELREWVAGRLARFKVPKAIEVAHALPRNASGKLLRRELR
ncbi:MAG TPA: AMP-binding protein [Solirubrobacteraceae bacterium]|nr:AMP-binding protein [Solirubrobacteraceae bacterium]